MPLLIVMILVRHNYYKYIYSIALHLACNKGKHLLLEILLDKSNMLNCLRVENKDGQTPISIAVLSNNRPA